MYEMDLFDQKYYRGSKLYLLWVGQWPFDNVIRRHLLLISGCFIMISQMAAKLCRVFTSFDDTDLVFDSSPPLLGNVTAIIKMATYYFNLDQLQELLNCIKGDWSKLKSADELEVLHRYAEQGRIISKYYARILAVTLALTVILPVAPRLIFGIGNASEPRPLPHNINYFVDTEEYYYPILCHAYMASALFILSTIAIDSMFIVFVQHACGMFSVIEYKLEHLVEDNDLDKNLRLPINDDVYYHTVRECIQLHNDIISYVEVMDSLYNLAFFLQAGLNMIIMSITAVRGASTLSRPSILIRQMIYSIAQITHLFFECYQCQQIIDHSRRIEKSLINSRWYLTSFRTRKLINFMLVRAQTPCTLTAGKLFVVSMEFCSVVRGPFNAMSTAM